MNAYPRRFEGSTTWDPNKVREADFDDFIMVSRDEILFELTYERRRYSGKLKRHGMGWFAGTFQSTGYAASSTGSARCSLMGENRRERSPSTASGMRMASSIPGMPTLPRSVRANSWTLEKLLDHARSTARAACLRCSNEVRAWPSFRGYD